MSNFGSAPKVIHSGKGQSQLNFNHYTNSYTLCNKTRIGMLGIGSKNYRIKYTKLTPCCILNILSSLSISSAIFFFV